MRMKRTVAALFCAMLLTALLPGTAFAAGKAAIQLGTGGVNANDKVYFGKYGIYDVPWIVLPSGTLSETTTITGALPLLSEYLLGNSQFRAYDDWGYYNFETTGNTSNSGILKETLESYYNGTNKLFTNAEQNAVADTELTGNSMYSGQPALPGQKLFPLSQTEAGSLTWGSNILQAKYRDTGSAGQWWRRSSYSRGFAFCVDEDGDRSIYSIDGTLGVRPAFNLNLSSVLFTAAADNSGQNATFSAPTAYSEKAWKLTLKDGNSFATGTVKTSGNTALTTGYAAQALTFSHAALSSFTGAGYTNVTAALANTAGDLLYYGSINTAADATSSSITIPARLAVGSYTLTLYAEDRNGVHTTDYATGVPFRQTITVTAPPSASIDGTSSVTGTIGSPLNAKPYSLTLTNVSLIGVPSSAEFTSWTQNMPAGVNVTVTTGSSTVNAVSITIDGTPTEARSAPFSIIIPKEKLSGNQTADLTVTAGTNARWAIAAPGVVETPVFSPAAGAYTSAQSVTLSCATAGAEIRYTTDGNDPTDASTLFVAGTPIAVTSTTTIRAKAFMTGITPSAVAFATYTVNTTPPGPSGPTIISPTANRTVPVTIGSPATLSVTATGATGYQWWINRGRGFEIIPDATGASHAISPVTLANNGYQYYCVVTGNGGSVTSPIFTLQVTEPIDVPATGDNFMPGLWLGIMLMAGAVLTVNTVLYRRKRCNH